MKTSKLIFRILIAILIVALIVIAGILLTLHYKYTARWGDGKISDYEISQIIPAAKDIIRGQVGDDRDMIFSDDSQFYEFEGYYVDWWDGDPIINVYGMKGSYCFIDEDEFNNFEYVFKVTDTKGNFEF